MVEDGHPGRRFRIRTSRLADSILEVFGHTEELQQAPAGPAPFPTRSELPQGVTLISTPEELVEEVIRELDEES